MKELSVEEKAKRYNEALSRAKEICATLSDKAMSEYIFPELKESEDERVRKTLIDYFNTCHGDYYGELKRKDILAWLEKQGEQKPIDKVEPKSNIEKGKWYVCDTSRYTDFVVGKAYFCPKNGMLKPNENEIARYVAKDCFHLWIIQDAKDGDVLYSHEHNLLWIYKDKDTYYVAINLNYTHNISNGADMVIPSDVCPATKEQHEQLKKAMADAGYVWNAEKKELKKIHVIDEGKAEMDYCFTKMMNGERVSPAWSEEDEEELDIAVSTLKEAGQHDSAKWLKSLKDRYSWKPSDEEIKTLLRTEYEKGRADAITEMQKPVDCTDCTNSKGCINCKDGNMKETLVQTAWSEEDEEMLNVVIKSCEKCGNEYVYYWLKSLKDRVQPRRRHTIFDEII